MSKTKDDAFRLIIDVMDRAVGDYWMDAGTCLGIHRNGDFVAQKDDVDIGIFGDLAHLGDTLIPEFEAKGFKLAKKRDWRGYLQTIGFTGPEKLDLFFYHEKDGFRWHAVCGWEDERQKRKVFKPEKYEARLFEDLKKVRFKDRDVYLPNPPGDYLFTRYGPSWMRPDPNYRFWRDSHAIDMEFI